MMDKRTGAGLVLALFLGAAGIFCLWGLSFRKQALPTSTSAFTVMGTAASFSFAGAENSRALEAHARGRAAFDRVVRTANLYDPQSELSRLNASAHKEPFVCSGLLWQMIEEAAFAYHFTGGAFDITVKPLMDLWGFYRKRGKAPVPAEILAVRKKVGFDKLILDRKKRSVRFSQKGMALDLGGIAKGFALDLAAQEISPLIGTGVLDLGGNLKFLPSPPPGRGSYSVGIRDPLNRDRLEKTLSVPPGMAVSTSGSYERFVTYGSRQFGHIMDPAAGFPPQRGGSVTVIAPSAMRADWLSTAVFLRRGALARKVEKELAGCRVIEVKK